MQHQSALMVPDADGHHEKDVQAQLMLCCSGFYRTVNLGAVARH